MNALKSLLCLALICNIGVILLLVWSINDCRKEGSGKWAVENLPEFLQSSNSQSDIGAGSLKQIERPNMLLVTSVDSPRCEAERGTEFTLKSVQNKIDYARLHNISIYNGLEIIDPKYDSWWIKTAMLKRLMLAYTNIEWFLWFDMDVLITDMSLRIPLEKYDGYDVIFHGSKKGVLEEGHYVALNNGVMLIRNTEWSMTYLNALLEIGEPGEVRASYGQLFSKKLKGRKPFDADDQAATVYMLKYFPEKWLGRTYIDEEFRYSSWFKSLIPSLEAIEQGHSDVQLPFTSHFNGCKFCHGYGELSDECVATFDRFYHYANDQVLKTLGLKHKSLDSEEIIDI